MPPEKIESGILPAAYFLFENLQTTMLMHEDEICFNRIEFFCKFFEIFLCFIKKLLYIHKKLYHV